MNCVHVCANRKIALQIKLHNFLLQLTVASYSGIALTGKLGWLSQYSNRAVSRIFQGAVTSFFPFVNVLSLLLFSGYRGVPLLDVKQLGIGADHLSPSSAKVKNEWSYTSAPPYAFMACIGIALPLLYICCDCEFVILCS